MGAVDYIYRICCYLLSDPKLLESVGDPSEESLSPDALASIRSGGFRTGPLWLPKNQARVMAARDLALLTCYFILLHEAGHIIRCHSAFMKRNTGSLIMKNSRSAGWPVTSQTSGLHSNGKQMSMLP